MNKYKNNMGLIDSSNKQHQPRLMKSKIIKMGLLNHSNFQ